MNYLYYICYLWASFMKDRPKTEHFRAKLLLYIILVGISVGASSFLDFRGLKYVLRIIIGWFIFIQLKYTRNNRDIEIAAYYLERRKEKKLGDMALLVVLYAFSIAFYVCSNIPIQQLKDFFEHPFD